MSVALSNIKVIDLSRILAGPWASQMLADLGAQVIKVERPDTGDDTRHWGPPFIKEATEDRPAQTAYFHCANRNKQSIAIDISTEEGQNIIRDLVLKSDVFIENYKVGTLKKYRLDYQSLKLLNPKLIYCSITGFGQTGPYANKAGYDAMIQAEGGLMSITGDPQGEPMKVGVAVTDIMTGLYSCNAILAALMALKHTFQGQHIDMALLDVQVAALANQAMNYLATAENPPRLGNAHPNIVPYQIFACQDGNITLAVGNDNQFKKFCSVADIPEIALNPNYSSNAQRVANRNSLIPILAKTIAEKPSDWWIKALEKVSVPCGCVNTFEQVFNHPQIKHRKMIRQVSDNHGKKISTIASPINLSQTPIQYKSAAPDLGQHTHEVLSIELGYNQEKINDLFNGNIVG
ncbi:MAG: CoA transferase [Alteromonadaceae bacterium]|nr:CoA transferase [Alteromonadaceae bacterium]